MNWSVILFLSLVVIAFILIFYFALPRNNKKQNISYMTIDGLVHNHNSGSKINEYINLLSDPSNEYPKISYIGWKSRNKDEKK